MYQRNMNYCQDVEEKSNHKNKHEATIWKHQRNIQEWIIDYLHMY